MRSMVGSLARLRKRTTFSSEPFSSSPRRREFAVSELTPMAARRCKLVVAGGGAALVHLHQVGLLVRGARLFHEISLAADLRGDLVMGETGGAEEGNLLPARRDVVHDADGADPLDHLLGVGALGGVDGRALNVEVLLGHHGGSTVDGNAGAVEDAPEHVLGHGRLEHLTGELELSVATVHARGALEHLDHGALAVHLDT